MVHIFVNDCLLSYFIQLKEWLATKPKFHYTEKKYYNKENLI